MMDGIALTMAAAIFVAVALPTYSIIASHRSAARLDRRQADREAARDVRS